MVAPLILVVDDDDTFLSFMRDLLAGEGYRVATSGTAGGVLRLVREMHPALVILDLAMGTKEAGMDALWQLRADFDATLLPVLVCTADHRCVERHGGRLAMLRAAAIAKPFALDVLIDRVRRLMAL